MATFRKIQVSFWSDAYVQTLTPEQKYFFLYLLTNEKTKQCGIYEITIRHISYDTGYNSDTINLLLKKFFEDGKLIHNSETNEIAIKNWDRYNGSESPSLLALVNKELTQVKDEKLILWRQCVDTESPREEKRREEKRKEERTLDYLFSGDFKPIWERWIDYKRQEHKEKYRMEKTEQQAIKNLFSLSGKDAGVAEKIIDQSISNRWKGLFELKKSFHSRMNLSSHQQEIENKREQARGLKEA